MPGAGLWKPLVPADESARYPLGTAHIQVSGKADADGAAAEIAAMLTDGQATSESCNPNPGWHIKLATGWLDDEHSGQIEVFVSAELPRKLAECDDAEVLAVLMSANIQHTEAATYATGHGWPCSEAAVRRWRKNPTVTGMRVLDVSTADL